MSAARPSTHGAVHWLTAQAVLFGGMAALLGVVANALFLEAYGPRWLPVTYIVIGVLGVVVSGMLARGAARFDLVPLAVSVLGGAAGICAAAWAIAAAGDGAWVSAPLLVLFPVLVQLGFVFIGSQAGRILDIAGIKASFPRIMTGFPVGAVIGGLVAGPLVDLTGRTEHLLLATAIVEGAFAALVWATGRRYAALLAAPEPAPDAGPGVGAGSEQPTTLRRLLARRFVALILGYQVLSALGSQLSDFLVFDRASAQFSTAQELARFVAGYTAVMNALSIVFLFAVAGRLLRPYGLRLGIAANPAVVTVFAVLMLAVLAVGGPTSGALLVVVSAARIADIALSDGTTRTSINATYQVLPGRDRLAAQTAVEGMGVPMAIGVSGVLILVLNALPVALLAMIVALGLLCAAWTWAAVLLYRAYGPALVDALAVRRLLDSDARLEAGIEDAAVATGLLVGGDTRSARLGLELASTIEGPWLAPELTSLAGDERVDVRLAALAGLAASGDADARCRLGAEARTAAGSPDAALRRRAAVVMSVLDPGDRRAVAGLLEDPVAAVRVAALESVQAGDTFAVDAAVAALASGVTTAAAMDALGGLGDAAVPHLAAILASEPAASTDAASGLVASRLVRAITTPTAARDEVLAQHIDHADRELGRWVMERLGGPGPAAASIGRALDAVFARDTAHAAEVCAALAALSGDGDAAPPLPDGDEPLVRALEDELALTTARVVAGRTARHGRARVGAALRRVASGASDTGLAVEALEVAVGAGEAGLLVALLAPGLAPGDRLDRLAAAGVSPVARTAEGWLNDLVTDADAHWGSSWLRACAIHAAHGRGLQDVMDVAAARAAPDPLVQEELSAVRA